MDERTRVGDHRLLHPETLRLIHPDINWGAEGDDNESPLETQPKSEDEQE